MISSEDYCVEAASPLDQMKVQFTVLMFLLNLSLSKRLTQTACLREKMRRRQLWPEAVLGGPGVVITEVISRLTMITSTCRVLGSLLLTSPGPPSRGCIRRLAWSGLMRLSHLQGSQTLTSSRPTRSTWRLVSWDCRDLNKYQCYGPIFLICLQCIVSYI